MITKHGKVVIYNKRIPPLTNVRSHENLKNLYVLSTKVIVTKLRALTSGRRFSTQTLKF